MVERISLQGHQLNADLAGNKITVFKDDLNIRPETVEGEEVTYAGLKYIIYRAIDPFKPPHAPKGHTNADKFLEFTVARPNESRPNELPAKNSETKNTSSGPSTVTPNTRKPYKSTPASRKFRSK
jgi:hypothetical protein